MSSHFPEHRAYVEVFGGPVGVLLQKRRSNRQVYNDLDHQVVGLFRVLRDVESRGRLIRDLALTPFSREEFDGSYEASADPVEAARKFIVRCFVGHGTRSIDQTTQWVSQLRYPRREKLRPRVGWSPCSDRGRRRAHDRCHD
ncbi:MAG: hypothetical protein IPL39_14595 [Opitutaceae bacterium]|nr:hypothetical protein [Opitutaceae bacterium]